METSQIYVIIAIVALAILCAVIFFARKNKKRNQLTPLTGLAFGFIIAGILFADSGRWTYSFFGVAIILAVIDMVMKMKKAKVERPKKRAKKKK